MRLQQTSTALLLGSLVAAAGAIAPSAALAQQTGAANEQVVVPEVDRRDVRKPHYPSNDFSIALFGGAYATQNFGSSLVGGVKLGYHITEDFFVEAAYAQTKVSDEAFRQILPGGVFVDRTEKLSYYNLSAGWNVLPGEVFIGRNRALASQLYLIAGVGSTSFVDQNKQTINFGFGYRVFLNDHAALQLDARDHLYSLDILGQRQNTQNLELTAGFAYFF